jgi:hypothetical protein
LDVGVLLRPINSNPSTPRRRDAEGNLDDEEKQQSSTFPFEAQSKKRRKSEHFVIFLCASLRLSASALRGLLYV